MDPLSDVLRAVRLNGAYFYPVEAGAPWYATLLLPPALILTVLLCLKTLASPVYTPNRFFVGVSFGIVAGLFEEIGWTGYAFPKMARTGNGLGAAIALGM